jgi:hypothetical protein
MELLEALSQNIDLYQLDFSQGPVIFQLLPYDSYLGFKRIIINHPRMLTLVEEEIWRTCIVVDPFKTEDSSDYLDYLNAGIISTVAQVVLFLSEPKDFEDLLDQLNYAREQVASVFHLQAQAFICRAFPGINSKELLHLTIPELLIRISQAEYITGLSFDIQSPEKQTRKKAVDFSAENLEHSQHFGINPLEEL